MHALVGGTRHLVLLGLVSLTCHLEGAEIFRAATYNLEGYLDTGTQSRGAKSAEARTAVRESIRALNPDVLALQEVGGLSALQELRLALKGEGLDFPYWEHVPGHDTN